MRAPGEFSPDSVEVTENEIANLSVCDGMKWLGCLEIRSDQPMPLTGRDPEYGEEGLVIPRSSTGNVMLHINFRPEGAHDIRRSLALAASYIALHEQLRNMGHIVGVTHPQAARVATRFGFRAMRPEPLSALNEKYQGALRVAYERVGQEGDHAKPPLEQVGIIYMPISMFIDTYAIPHLGRDPQALLDGVSSRAVGEVASPESDDPVLHALRDIQRTMNDNPS